VAGDIAKGQQQFSIAKQVHRLVAECREGGKAAEQADEKKGAGIPRDGAANVGQFSKKPDHHTAEHINRQGAERKLDALAELLDISAHEVAKDRADKTACADKE